jgi:hypothetical protein
MANSEAKQSLTRRRRCVQSDDPVRHLGAAGFFSPPIHSHAQVSCVSYIQRRAICYLGDRITCVAGLRRFGGAARMVPVARRERFTGGVDVQPTR